MNYWVNLQLPKKVLVKGHVPTSQDVEWLDSDMVEIDLPDGTTIDVGWVPAHDIINGNYRIVVYKDYWEQQVEQPIYTRSQEKLVQIIQDIVHRRCNEQN